MSSILYACSREELLGSAYLLPYDSRVPGDWITVVIAGLHFAAVCLYESDEVTAVFAAPGIYYV